jgi:hypothetical protein
LILELRGWKMSNLPKSLFKKRLQVSGIKYQDKKIVFYLKS